MSLLKKIDYINNITRSYTEADLIILTELPQEFQFGKTQTKPF